MVKSNRRLNILDLFCGAGGASMGYYHALDKSVDVSITGVDNHPQKRYPFNFIRADALDYVKKHGHEYDFIAASPPCQFASQITPDKLKHHNFIPVTREALQASGAQYCIENVTGARNHLRYPIMICGSMFPNLRVYRHRYFETSLTINAPGHSPHDDYRPVGMISVAAFGQSWLLKNGENYRKVTAKGFVTVTGDFRKVAYARNAMGIDWMTTDELNQAIPPPYTQYIGAQMFRQMGYHTIAPEMNAPVQLSLFSGLQEAIA